MRTHYDDIWMGEDKMKALVTGASSGIGRDIARELSKKGYELILVARDLDKLKKVKSEMQTPVETVSMDLSKLENCRRLYETYPQIDLLVNDAGFGDCGYFTDTSLEKEVQMIRTNIIAAHTLMKLYLTNMKKRDSGVILNVASLVGFLPGPLMATYYATKAYLIRLSEAIREELKKEHSQVQISLLCPGPVHTNFNRVANVQFLIKGFSSEYVAQYAVNKLSKGKFYIVPGPKAQLAKALFKLLPTAFTAKCAYAIHKPA